MRIRIMLASLASAVALLAACSAADLAGPATSTNLAVKTPSAVVNTSCEQRNGEGWNFNSRLFQGRAAGADFSWDCLYYGDPAFGNDHLLVNWNAEFDRYRIEHGANPPYVQACYSNLWNGQVAGGSGQSSYIKLCVSPTCASWIQQPWNSDSFCSGGYEVVAWFGRIGTDRYLIVDPYMIPANVQH